MANSLHSVRFPGEGAEYRAARDQLLEAEFELRERLDKVAALRKGLPVGGVVEEDYVFEEAGGDLGDSKAGKQVRLSELFGDKDSLILYSFMYGPEMPRPCPSCTSILDGLDGTVPHVRERVSIAVVAKSPAARIRQFALERKWRNLRLLSSAQNTYNADYHGETPDGQQIPALNVFTRRQGRIHHFYNTELLYVQSTSGADPRHVDLIWPLWNLFDLTPEGRGTDWYPRLSYGGM